MADSEKRFFCKMKRDVIRLVKKHGLSNIIGWRVTEKGIGVKLKNG